MKKNTSTGDIATNHKAYRDFAIDEKYEAGIVLRGSEVKSICAGKANLDAAFARVENNEVFLYGCHISPYGKNPNQDHEPLTTRKLLLTKREIRKLQAATQIAHRTIVAIKFFWLHNKVKVLIGVGIGKNKGDKRQDLKKADARREMDRALKG